MIDDLVIRKLESAEPIPYDLLLIADPSKSKIDTYITDSVLYVAEVQGNMVGCYVLCTVNEETGEIKNIVVSEKFQGKGIGTAMLNDATTKAKLSGFKKLLIGTGNSSIGQLYLYQKTGFRMVDIKADFFTQGYDEPIIENGIECRDMIILMKEL